MSEIGHFNPVYTHVNNLDFMSQLNEANKNVWVSNSNKRQACNILEVQTKVLLGVK